MAKERTDGRTFSLCHCFIIFQLSLVVNRRLTKPDSINISQKYSDVTIMWHSSYKCKKDVPDVYRIFLKNNENGFKQEGVS